MPALHWYQYNHAVIFNGGPVGALATIDCEFRQAWKGAAVTVDSGAEVLLIGLPPILRVALRQVFVRPWRKLEHSTTLQHFGEWLLLR